MKKIKKYALIAISVLLLIPCFAVFSSANDVDLEGQATTTVATPASNIESMKFGIADGPNGGVSTMIEMDFTNVLRSTDLDGYTINYNVPENNGLTQYRINVSFNRVTGYLKNSIYTAVRFYIAKYVWETDAYVFAGYASVKTIDITYKMHVIHNHNQVFNRPYDGNIDSTIGITGNTGWTTSISYKTVGFDYRMNVDSLDDETPSLAYYTLDFDTNLHSKSWNSTSVTDPKYIKVGLRYDYPNVNMSTVTKFYQSTPVPQITGYDKYRYSVCTYARQSIVFDEAYNGIFTVTDMFTPNTIDDMQFMMQYGLPSSTSSDFGTFLRNSLESFLKFQIFPSFTLGDLLWTIIGFSAVFALVFLLLGK